MAAEDDSHIPCGFAGGNEAMCKKPDTPITALSREEIQGLRVLLAQYGNEQPTCEACRAWIIKYKLMPEGKLLKFPGVS